MHIGFHDKKQESIVQAKIHGNNGLLWTTYNSWFEIKIFKEKTK